MASTFFYLSKILWFFVNPFHFLILLATASLLLLKINRIRLAKIILTLTVTCMIAISIYPLGDLLLSPLEQRFIRPENLPNKIDGIIILGGSINQKESAAWGTLESNSSSERITKGAALAKMHPKTQIVFTGGSGLVMGTDLTEAEIAEQMLVELGLDKSRIVLEDKSRNTYQNATLTKKELNDNINGNWILITSAFHMPRSVGVFRKVGWNTIPFPVDFKSLPAEHRHFRFGFEKNMKNLELAIHEWIGLAAYYYTDKSSELFPQ